MENRMMNKNEVLQRIDAVCKNLDGGITVSDVRSAGNLAGCFAILQETLAFLAICEIVQPEQENSET